MFTVTGLTADGTAYAVRIDAGHKGEFGTIVEATPVDVMYLLDAHTGEQYAPTPVHAAYTLDLADPASILTALFALTEVRGVDGDAPALVDLSAVPPGAVA